MMNPKTMLAVLTLAGPMVRPEEEEHIHEETRVPDGRMMNQIRSQVTTPAPSTPYPGRPVIVGMHNEPQQFGGAVITRSGSRYF
jgi:hypothetical protein